ncbi:APC family permease [Leptolyngbya sp. FACHB-36]|uniref:APC family permease n=1 Tax=Leptolyngbya sp. FACHB-36 TaxID=2692808 RepID=UPI0016807C56|nr:APC family permease [Leptolyngbya sp. FACHB-36]MBD2022217.1 APC family permease [Leptolyngbya sp. FACHB-36]
MTVDIQSARSAHGLKSECLSFKEVLAQSFAVIAPTTTPAANLGLIFALSGNGTCLSFLLGTLGLMFVCVNINQFAKRSASPGSLYSYIAKSLGPMAGVVCGWSLVLAYLFTGMATLCGLSIFGESLLGHLGLHLAPITLLAIGAGIAWYMAHRDIQLSATSMLIIEGVSACLILLLGVIVWAHKGFAIDVSQFTLQGSTPSGIAMGLVLVVFGFSGFESATSLGDEARKPLKTIPKSVMSSTILTGLFFIVMGYIEVLGFSGSSASLANYEEPLTFLADQAGVGLLGQVIGVSALLSFYACVLGSINPAARVFFMMARHGLFPTSLGETHRANRTPHIAITICSLLIFLVPAGLSMLGLQPFQSMGFLGTICTYGFLTVYILVCIAAPVYLHRIGKLRRLDVVFSVLGVAFMLLPVVGMVGVPGSDVFPVPEYPYNLFPWLFLLYLLLGCGWFIVKRRRSPGLVKKMQQRVDELHAQFATPAPATDDL